MFGKKLLMSNTPQVVEGLESFLLINATNIVFSDYEVITCITPSDATGTISLIVSGIEPTSVSNMYTSQISSGNATFIIENLPAGSYNATGTYAGDSKYKSSTYTTTFEVSKLIIDPDEIKVIDQGNGTIIVVMPEEDFTGALSVKYQGNVIQTETLEDGFCVFDLNGLLPSGEIDIDIYYPGDSNYSSATRSETINMPNNNAPI